MKTLKKTQQGITLLTTLFRVVIFCFLAILTIQIIPVYLQYYTILSSVHSLKKLPADELADVSAANVPWLKNKLINQLQINQISIPTSQIQVTINASGHYQIDMTYQVTKPIITHLSLLFNFHITEVISSAP